MPEAPRKARVSGPQLDFEQTADWRRSKAAEARRREWQMTRYQVEVDRIERLGKAIEATQRAGRAVRDFAGHVADSV